MLFKSIIYILIFSQCFADIDETLFFCKTSPPKLINGLIKRDRVSYYNGQGYLGTMEYTCLPAFNLDGNKIVTCQNGIWSAMPQCISKKRCSPIKSYPLNTIIESNNLTLFQNDPQQILVGSTITLRCIDNYEYDPTSTGSLIIQCQNDGSWTSMPTCRHIQSMCDYSKLYLPSHSRITRMDLKFSQHNQQYHLVGSNLEYTCDDGYRLNDGKTSLIVQCLDSGSWSTLPVCESYQTERNPRCPYPNYIKNGFIAVYNVTIWEDRTYTGRIVYECNYGFETLNGNDKIISECVDGTWIDMSDCQEIPTCRKEELLEIESQVENSYVYNVSLQYIRDPSAFVYNSYVLRVCLPNYEHDPSSPPLKVQCQRHTNTWTGIPICRAINTYDEIRIHSDNLIFNQFESTTTTDVIETTHTIFCNANDVPLIPNSIVISTESNSTYNVGTTLYFSCQSGYNQTSYSITCLMNGTWMINTDDISICKSIIENETTEDTSTISWNITEENSTSLNLDEDLPILNLTNETMISSTPSISASHRQVREVVSYCNQFPQIEHAQLLIDDTIKHNKNHEIVYSGSVLFICQLGYRSDSTENEPFKVTCQDGIFHPKIQCIEKPRCSLPPPIDTRRSSVTDSLIHVFDTSTNESIPGSFVLLNCLDKTNGEKSVFNMTCQENGKWLLPPPPCVASFKRRCQSTITIPNARTQVFAKITADGYYDDGSRASYRCLENFIHDRQSGPLYIQCRNGRWGPRPRCIPNGCLEPLSDTIENGWKSGETYVIQNDMKYYLLTRYSCYENAVINGSSLKVTDIQCRNNQWQHESLPVCQFPE